MSHPASFRAALVSCTLATLACAQTAAPESRPDPKEIPLPPIKTAFPALPGVNALPVRAALPDVLTMNDGTKVTTVDQWKKRRQEMLAILEHYAVGHRPPAPGNVKGRVVNTETVADGKVKYRLVHLTFGPEEKLSLDIGIFTPAEGGPFPAIISQSGSPPGATALPKLPQGPTQGKGLDVLLVVGPAPSAAPADNANAAPVVPVMPVVPGQESNVLPPPGSVILSAPTAPGRTLGSPAAEVAARRYAELFRRGYALVMYNTGDCAEDTTLREADGSWAFRHTRFYPAYPGYDWGILAGWAWGASRIADYLETDPAIDKTKLVITGASRAGKSSMIAAAFDERLIGAPVVTGGGGVGAYRFAGPRNSETLDIMQKKYPNWFSPNLHEFWGQREKLPFDEHWFLALCAPRPFIALEGDADVISYYEAVKQSMIAARPAYALFGAQDKLGVNYAHHAHAFTPEDWTAMMDFVDKTALGKKVERTFDRFPTEQELDAALARPAPARPTMLSAEKAKN